ncbi:MAG: phenylacetate--CoA ligase [Clostridiales bacterium]|jgi:phenylacetate-CoA ligase|nr:phenylacetate--CoA ligase [Clostridiales bacterium]
MTKYYNEQVETASRDQMFYIQSLALTRKIKQVYDNVPLYRQRMDEAGIEPGDIRSVEDLGKLPFTHKQDLRDTYPYGMFAVPMDEVVRIHASSGTTGRPTVVGYTKRDIELWSECTARALVAAGTERNDYIHVSYGYGLFTGGLGLHYAGELIGATVIPASAGNTARQIQILRDFGSSILCCTPSYALYIADTLRDQGIAPEELNLKAGIFGAEPWTDNMRREIESRLHIKAYDIYGLSEICGPGVSFDCECQNGLHVNEDHFIIEIVDPETGNPLSDGQYGEVVFSCVTKEALPLIRYNTHDISAITRERCACGRTLTRMHKIAGRTDDMIIIRGVNVFPSQIESVLLSIGEVDPHYLIIVDRINNRDMLEIQVEVSQSMFSDSVAELERLEAKIKAAVDSVLGLSAKITLVEPFTIPRSEGKAKRVIDKRKDK